MNPELLLIAAALWVHTIRDVLQDAHRWNWFTRTFHFSDNHWSELPTAILTAATGTVALLWGL